SARGVVQAARPAGRAPVPVAGMPPQDPRSLQGMPDAVPATGATALVLPGHAPTCRAVGAAATCPGPRVTVQVRFEPAAPLPVGRQRFHGRTEPARPTGQARPADCVKPTREPQCPAPTLSAPAQAPQSGLTVHAREG